MKKTSLSIYVTSVVLIIILVNFIVWVTGMDAEIHDVMTFSLGFLLGMLAMYIAVHIYRWK